MSVTSDATIKLNKALHEDKEFGTSGYRWTDAVRWICNKNQINHVLDYGAGKQTLAGHLIQSGFDGDIFSYDPAVAELSGAPLPADLVVCTDVLEHVEFDQVGPVLDHLSDLTKKFIFIHVPKGPAEKNLADGRNAHLIQKPLEWWLPLFMSRFELISMNNLTHGISFYGSTKTNHEDPIGQIINNWDLSEMVYFNFDGMCVHIGLKSKTKLKRILSKVLGLFWRKGRTGITKYIQNFKNSISVNMTYF